VLEDDPLEWVYNPSGTSSMSDSGEPVAAASIFDAAMPKAEIGALRFLEHPEHRQFDGRGVTIAIFDTGWGSGSPGPPAGSRGLAAGGSTPGALPPNP
jgi:hypothetical protein